MRTYFPAILTIGMLVVPLQVHAASQTTTKQTASSPGAVTKPTASKITAPKTSTTSRTAKKPTPSLPTTKRAAPVTERFVTVDNDRWGYSIDLPIRLVRSADSTDDRWRYSLDDNSFVVQIVSATDAHPNDSLAALQRAREQELLTSGNTATGRKVTKHWYSTDWSTGPRVWHERVERQQDYTVTLTIDFDANQAATYGPIAAKIRSKFFVAS